MFTGIVECVGIIRNIQHTQKGKRFTIQAEAYKNETLIIGESIAVEGVCLTVTGIEANGIFTADASPETLNLTTLGRLKSNDAVNLERALTLSSRLGGHLIAGHVDAVATILQIQNLGEFQKWVVQIPSGLERYVAAKGSVALAGVSLTVNRIVNGSGMELMLIPHTVESTTLRYRKTGDGINLEVDMLARYVERLLDANSDTDSRLKSLLTD